MWSLYRLRVLVASDRVLASGDLLNPSSGFRGRTAGCVSLFSLLRFWFTFLPWLCPSGSQWQSPGKSALRPPASRPCAPGLAPWPSRLSGVLLKPLLSSSFLEINRCPRGIAALSWNLASPGNSSFPCQFSKSFSQAFAYISSRFSSCPQRTLFISLEVADPFIIIIFFYSNISPLLCLFPSFDLNASQVCYWSSSYHYCFSVESQV